VSILRVSIINSNSRAAVEAEAVVAVEEGRTGVGLEAEGEVIEVAEGDEEEGAITRTIEKVRYDL
jgi:hypothetical protein